MKFIVLIKRSWQNENSRTCMHWGGTKALSNLGVIKAFEELGIKYLQFLEQVLAVV